ncbi:response regulator [Vibrio brasiliensis]|uniref:Response regulator protein n=1 Tax=Vibrio brasiliensis LMG 20546 TaxID=945543 RepID=E8LZZ3_9VIBR|nr:response regulator [Vibrio brasiliensis]EGA63740.1 response regulator protein [Vibrio brasiliensis LMG 20546]
MNILVCDDSLIARKSIISRISPSDSLQIFQAENGKSALETMTKQNIDLLFLDLTMPVMDGFEVLASLPINHYPTHIVVVSGDIQVKAKNRCLELGAHEFIEKPFVTSDLVELFDRFAIPLKATTTLHPELTPNAIDLMGAIREMSNVALGASASIIAEQVGKFIEMPLPNVASLHQSELKMTVQDIVNNSESRAVSQRFVGNGINGEALVCLHGSGFEQLASNSCGEEVNSTNEVILDISNLLVSSFLVSFSKQLDISISLRQPIVLEKEPLQVSLNSSGFLEEYDQDIFTIEFVYKAENLDVACDIIFLMDNESLDAIQQILESLI